MPERAALQVAPRRGFHAVDPALADLGGEHLTEAMPPEPNRFVAYIYAALVEQVVDIPER